MAKKSPPNAKRKPTSKGYGNTPSLLNLSVKDVDYLDLAYKNLTRMHNKLTKKGVPNNKKEYVIGVAYQMNEALEALAELDALIYYEEYYRQDEPYEDDDIDE